MKKNKNATLLTLIVLISVSLTSGLELTASTGGNDGSSSTHVIYGATVDDYANEHIGLSPEDGTLSNAFSGTGSLPSGSISKTDSNGNKATVSRSVDGKPGYTTWTYDWGTSSCNGVSAWLSMNVKNAYNINGAAAGSNTEGDSAETQASVSSLEPIASLSNYKTSATATLTKATASQSAASASGDYTMFKSLADNKELDEVSPNLEVYGGSTTSFAATVTGTKTQATASESVNSVTGGIIQFRPYASNNGIYEGDLARTLAYITNGKLSGYSDTSTATLASVTNRETIGSASADRISVMTDADSNMVGGSTSDASSVDIIVKKVDSLGALFKGTIETSVGTNTKAAISGRQEGSIVDRAVAVGLPETFRDSGGKGVTADISMTASSIGSPSITGKGAFYVDAKKNEKIQGAVDAALDTDVINVAAGTYKENVKIDKSLTVNGAGSYNTIVDGNKLGSVFTIGTTDSNIDVTLSGLGITGGSGTQVGYFTNGGGVFNKGRTVIKNSRIFANSAVYGGGVENWGTATISGSTITGNTAFGCGGGMDNLGTATISGSTISGNSGKTATGYATSGGGISNWGTATITGSTISGNSATWGGGVWNYGTAIIKKGDHIYSNIADSDASGYGRGGGIYKSGGALIFQDNFGNPTTKPIDINSIVYNNHLQSNTGPLSNIEP